jgi:hypothetical protein
MSNGEASSRIKVNQQVAAPNFRDKPINAIFDGSIVLATEEADGVLAKFSGGEPSMKWDRQVD